MKVSLTKSFVLTVALLVVAELVTRIFFAQRMSGRFEYGYHPTSGFVENGDGTVNLIKAGGRRFIPQKFDFQRPTNVFRIMVVGDSVSRGPNLEDSYPSRTAEYLRADGFKAEGINLGMPGYGSRRKQVVLRQALRYHPSLVVLHINVANEYTDDREFNRAEAFKSWHPRNWLMKSYALRRLNEVITEKVFWQWLPTEVRTQAQVNDPDAQIAASVNPEKLRAWEDRVIALSRECIAQARAQGLPVVLVIQARIQRSANGTAALEDDHLDALAKPLTGEGVALLSMKELLRSQAFESLYSKDDVHLLPEGYKIVGRALADLIRQQGWLPAK